MATVFLDLEGRLIHLHCVEGDGGAPDDGAGAGRPARADWDALFSAAGLDRSHFRETRPNWTPPVYADEWKAWSGAWPELPDEPVRVEAAAFRGRPVYFRAAGEGSETGHASFPGHVNRPAAPRDAVFLFLCGVLLLVGGLLARRNLRAGRADVRGTRRLVTFYAAMMGLAWLLGTDHSWSVSVEASLVAAGLGVVVLWSLAVGLAYLGLEPPVRRRWPTRITSWNRLLAGRLRDPLVGRVVLIGAAAGVCMVVVEALPYALPAWLGPAGPQPRHLGLSSFSPSLLRLFATGAVDEGPLWMLVLYLLVVVCRRVWIALAVLFAVASVNYLGSGWRADTLPTLLASEAQVGLGVFVLWRFGLLPLVACVWVVSVLRTAPLTYDFSTWYAGTTALYFAALIGVAVWCFFISLGGRPLFAEE
jgi:serine/threonine-protein kinase